jgi:glutaminase
MGMNAATDPISAYLDTVLQRFAGLSSGNVADYIPELAKANPAHFGIALATVDGQVYQVGDSRVPFTIQSVSKPFVYGVALEDQGKAKVLSKVGVEPSGEAFNSISLEPGTGRPLNPMINAGAIAAASLVGGATQDERWARVSDALSAYAGRPLDLDTVVFESERDTGHRNRAIGHMLRNYSIIEDDPEPALDLYFRQCSLRVDACDLALMAATLANGGVNPRTGQRAVAAQHISAILSVMSTCGIYDFTGEWVYRVGLPAKSGVGGGILAVLPGQLGLAVFSPPLDERGNSVRGVQVFETLSSELGLHSLQPVRPTAAAVRSGYSLAQVRSKRRRLAAESQLLQAHGSEVAVFELQGQMGFASLEPLLRVAAASSDALRELVLDFQRVVQVDKAATLLLARLIEGCAERGQTVLLSRVRRDGLLEALGPEVAPRHARAYAYHAQLDLALEAAEQRLLARHGSTESAAVAMVAAAAATQGLRAHPLLAGLDDDDLQCLIAHLRQVAFAAGDLVIARGDAADHLLLVLRGRLSVAVDLAGGGRRRLATVAAGMTLGEAALLQSGRRGADVTADTEVECVLLSTGAYETLCREQPRLALHLMQGLLRTSAETVGRLTAEVAALSA